MKTKTKQELEKQIENYLEKASKHVYVIKGGNYYKIIPLYNEGKLYVATIIMGKGKVTMNVRLAMPERDFIAYGNDTANIFKRNMFPVYYKAKSIPYFKRMRKLIEDITPLINVDNKLNEGVVKAITTRLGELELVVK